MTDHNDKSFAWATWIHEITVYRDGSGGRFCCTAYVADDWVWRFQPEATYSWVGWGDTVADAISSAITKGDFAVGTYNDGNS